MFVSFFESLKYVGHLWPVAFLRVFMGYYYLHQANFKLQGDFLSQPKLAEQISQFIPTSSAPFWYKEILEQVVIPYWHIFANILMVAEFGIAISFLLGYLVRPFSLIGILISLNYLWISSPDLAVQYKAFIAIHITLGWLGAGRCLGFDYYFYKRMRGLWW